MPGLVQVHGAVRGSVVAKKDMPRAQQHRTASVKGARDTSKRARYSLRIHNARSLRRYLHLGFWAPQLCGLGPEIPIPIGGLGSSNQAEERERLPYPTE